jgi:cardiolipin synthase
LRDAAENYPAWLDAISTARRYIYFESYILRDDAAGRKFAGALSGKAREGVKVRLIYDWVGALGKTPARFWRALRDAGIDVRCFNPFRFSSPLGWVHRDHRKSLSVDGRVAFVSGLCVGDQWVGDPEHGIDPWRDTGVEVHGAAVAEVEEGFARVWSAAGSPIPHGERVRPEEMVPAGDANLRVVSDEPFRTGLLRLDQLIAAAARETLWLTDAYFAGTPTYVQALRSAAREGVDVRLLVPGGTDIPILRPLSRAGYRPLLDAGIRVFEWKGSMLHAKTAVADGQWSRVGSSNLNVASWLGNYECDVVAEDEEFAQAMERMYLDDLTNATEIVLSDASRRQQASRAGRPVGASGGGSAGRAAAGAIRLGNTVSAAITERRELTAVEMPISAGVGTALIALAIAALAWPRVVALPLALLVLWLGVVLVAKAVELSREQRARSARAARVVATERVSPS